MAVRLPLILVQSTPPNLAGTKLVEQVIGELIGRPGVDLMLVGDLGRLGENSSDRLTLESINSHVAVLDWGSAEVILQRCHDIGFQGSRAPHAGDPVVPPVAGQTRKIFAFDLAQSADAQALCESIRRLLESQQVKTFSLGVAPPPGGGVASGSELPISARAEPIPAVKKAAEPSATDRSEPPSPAGPPPAAGGSPSRRKPGPLDLDDLMDQFDQLDS